jgi:hypothetical protein
MLEGREAGKKSPCGYFFFRLAAGESFSSRSHARCQEQKDKKITTIFLGEYFMPGFAWGCSGGKADENQANKAAW